MIKLNLQPLTADQYDTSMSLLKGCLMSVTLNLEPLTFKISIFSIFHHSKYIQLQNRIWPWLMWPQLWPI